MPQRSPAVERIPNLVTFWTFQEPTGSPRVSAGAHRYRLYEGATPIERVGDGLFGPYAAYIAAGQWLLSPRGECSGLDLHGDDAQVSVVAWIKRKPTANHCEAIAGMWNETNRKRQYCLFLNLRIWNSGDQVCGHVSSIGGPTPGHPWCMDAAIGATAVPYDVWQCVAFTYDGIEAKSYLNGRLDARPERNPYPYPGGLFNAGVDGADFTVGAVHRSDEMGNWFHGALGGLAVFDRALTDAEMVELHRATIGTGAPPD